LVHSFIEVRVGWYKDEEEGRGRRGECGKEVE
jgi:hypothetical protein